jgi:hypothetical protein
VEFSLSGAAELWRRPAFSRDRSGALPLHDGLPSVRLPGGGWRWAGRWEVSSAGGSRDLTGASAAAGGALGDVGWRYGADWLDIDEPRPGGRCVRLGTDAVRLRRWRRVRVTTDPDGHRGEYARRLALLDAALRTAGAAGNARGRGSLSARPAEEEAAHDAACDADVTVIDGPWSRASPWPKTRRGGAVSHDAARGVDENAALRSNVRANARA